jgi:hypothetical protein
VLSTTATVGAPGASTLLFDDAAQTMDPGNSSPFRIQDGTMTAYLYAVSNGTPSFESQADPAHHVVRVVRSWDTADPVGPLHVMAYLIVFRPTGQPAPAVSGLTLQPAGNGATASAQVDGAPLSVTFQD